MVFIYTDDVNSSDYIKMNDLYFNLYTANMEFTDEDIKIIKQIDNAVLKPGMRIETEYGLGTIRDLSSGCKTVLNALKNKDKTVCADECGGNALEVLFGIDGVHIAMKKPERFIIPDNLIIIFNDKDRVVGSKGYEEWWWKKYASER